MQTIRRIALGACLMLTMATAAQAHVSMNSLRIAGSDVFVLAKFYQAAFGMYEVRRIELKPQPELFLNFGATVDAAKANTGLPLVIMHRDNDALKDPIAHVIFTVTDAKASVAAVKAAGGTVNSDAREYGNTGIFIAMVVDPAGNVIELIQTRRK